MTAVLVSRLKECYYPTWMQPWVNTTLEGPVTGYIDDDSRAKHLEYDTQRVRYFMQLFTKGFPLAPIEVETVWHHNTPISLEILDGHHRFAAAIALNVPTIKVDFGGVVDHLRWLEGKINTSPF